MPTGRVLVAVALLAGTAGIADSAPPPVERPPEFVAKVNAAIDHGVAFLRGAAFRDGDFGTYPNYVYALNAFAYHTLRSCGVPKDDPLAAATWGRLIDEYAQNRKHRLRTYSASLLLLALYDHGEPQPAAPGEPPRVKLSARDMAIAEDVAEWLTGTVLPDGGWGYYPGMHYLDPRVKAVTLSPLADHSNTQFALLGLRAAALSGVEVKDFVWLGALNHHIAQQAERETRDGRRAKTVSRSTEPAVPRGWSYIAVPLDVYGSMTASGVSSLTICREQLAGSKRFTPELADRCDEAVRDGLEWLARNFDAHRHPGQVLPPKADGLDVYWLYSLERAAILTGTDLLGTHDWYREGAEFLCERQLPSGAWRSESVGSWLRKSAERREDVQASMQREVDVVETCFALLFLKRATIPARPVVTAGDDLRFDAAAKLSGAQLADFLGLVITRWMKSPSADARSALEDGTASIGPQIVEPLIVRLDAADAAQRAAAFALLRHATGLDFGYAPDASDPARADAVQRWQSWWLKARASLRLDPVTRRLVESKP